VRIALPPAHFAREEAEPMLGDIGARKQQRRDPECEALRKLHGWCHAAASATGKHATARTTQGPERIIELELVDSLFRELCRRQLEARIIDPVGLESVVLQIDLVDQMAPQIAFAKQVLRSLGGVGVAELR